MDYEIETSYENDCKVTIKKFPNGATIKTEEYPQTAESHDEPIDHDVAMLELLSMTEYNTCLLEMQMEF